MNREVCVFQTLAVVRRMNVCAQRSTQQADARART